MSRRGKLAAAALAVVGVAAMLAWPHRARLRHLAVPVLTDPSVPSATPPQPIAIGPAAGARRVATLPARITAVATLDGALFLGTFDAGLFRFDPARDAAPVAVGDCDGRERFVDALLVRGGRVVAGTHGGALVLDGRGRRVETLADAEAVAALADVDGALVLGTAHGLWTDGAPLDVHGPDGEPLRVTALAVAGRSLYIGTSDGVYVAARPLRPGAARWVPLVFGAPAASTDVVTALAPLGDGVIAGTDDGGLVLVRGDGAHALPLSDARMTGVSPGALAAVGGAVWLGTDGAGLLRLAAAPAGVTVARPADWRAPRVSAVTAAAGTLFAGTDAGTLFALPLAGATVASADPL